MAKSDEIISDAGVKSHSSLHLSPSLSGWSLDSGADLMACV